MVTVHRPTIEKRHASRFDFPERTDLPSLHAAAEVLKGPGGLLYLTVPVSRAIRKRFVAAFANANESSLPPSPSQ